MRGFQGVRVGVQGVQKLSGKQEVAGRVLARSGHARAVLLSKEEEDRGAPGGLGQNRSWAGSAAGKKPRYKLSLSFLQYSFCFLFLTFVLIWFLNQTKFSASDNFCRD